MARELVIDVDVYSVEAEAALIRLYDSFRKAGDSAEVAGDKVTKFEKSYKDGSARKTAKAELDALSGSTDKVSVAAGKASTTQAAFTNALVRFAGPAALGAAIASTVSWAGQLSNLSKSTGISTTSLQKFESIGKSSGVTMNQIANASLQLSDRLAGGDKSAAKAMDRLGLSTGALLKMSPDRAMLEFAAALSKVQNPQERVTLAMDGMGRSAGQLLPVLMDMNDEWDKTSAKLSEEGVKALDDTGRAFDKLMDTGKGLIAVVLVPFAPLLEGILNVLTPLSTLFSKFMADVLSPFNPAAWREWADSLRDAARFLQYIVGIGPGILAAPLPLPGSPGSGQMPTPAGALPLPGNMTSIERALTAGVGRGGGVASGGATGGARVLPFQQRTFGGSSAASIWAMANTPGGFSAGRLPFQSSLMPLASGGSPLDFLNGMQVPGMVGMNRPGSGSGGFGSFFGRNKGQLGLLAGGLAAQFLPGRAGQVAQGAMGMAGQGAGLGAMFGPHGAAIGAGIGALVGGVSSLFGGGGKAKKNAKNAEISQVFEQFSTKDFIALQKEADKFGISMEKALTAKTMKDFGAAVDEVNTKLQEMNAIQSEIDYLTEQTTVGFDQMSAVAKEFGLDVNALGPAFQQASADKEIQKIIDALAIMEKGGADMNGVLDGMQDEISKVVQDSLKFGTTIPENMRPWIAKLAESGKLVDENGKSISDIEGLKFGDKMESQMDKLVRKLDELISKLAGVKAGFDDTKASADGLAGVDYGSPGSGSGNREGDPSGASTGMVAGRDFRRPGYGDIFPALLKRGERVLPAGVTGGGGVTVNVHLAGYLDSPRTVRDLKQVIVEAIQQDVRMQRAS